MCLETHMVYLYHSILSTICYGYLLSLLCYHISDCVYFVWYTAVLLFIIRYEYTHIITSGPSGS